MSGVSGISAARCMVTGAAIALSLAACASAPAPEAEMARADLAVNQAEDADEPRVANRLPPARRMKVCGQARP